MRDKLQVLTDKKRRLDSFRPLPAELVKNLDEWFRVELTYTSNAIEGNTLTRAETALVVEKGLTVAGKSLSEHLEATNHVEALEFVKTLVAKRRQEIVEEDVLQIHRLVLRKIEDEWAGRYRTLPARLTGSETVLPNPAKVPILMQEFMGWLVGENKDHVVKIAGEAHFRLVSIHPFADGNGRTARLLMNLILMQAGYPPAIIRKEDRLAYVDSLEKGQVKGEVEDFYKLIYEAVERSLDIYLAAVEPQEESKKFYTTEQVAKLLQVDPESVRRWVRSGKLKAVRLGGRFMRIEQGDLERFIG